MSIFNCSRLLVFGGLVKGFFSREEKRAVLEGIGVRAGGGILNEWYGLGGKGGGRSVFLLFV